MSETEHWRELAEAVAREYDPVRMIALVKELNRALANQYASLTGPTRQNDGTAA
jgi:hypothetical protein